jgi:PHAX RNA-binding domain
VRNIPKDIIIEIFLRTIEVQCSGGMNLAGDGDQKKSAGGVFMALIKKSTKYSY